MIVIWFIFSFFFFYSYVQIESRSNEIYLELLIRSVSECRKYFHGKRQTAAGCFIPAETSMRMGQRGQGGLPRIEEETRSYDRHWNLETQTRTVSRIRILLTNPRDNSRVKFLSNHDLRYDSRGKEFFNIILSKLFLANFIARFLVSRI